MIGRITLVLNEQENLALRTLAQREFREPRQQASLIIRMELERLGLIQKGVPQDEVDISEPTETAKQPAS
jgi:hypothetical protein